MMPDIDRRKVHTIMNRVNPYLRRQLNLDEDFLRRLMAIEPEAISEDDLEDINTVVGKSKKVDFLCDLIKRKSVESYSSFMKVLQKKDLHLYNETKAIQDECCKSGMCMVYKSHYKLRLLS